MSGEYTSLPEDLAHLRGFRVNDLVAKTAGVSLKNTTRALLAAELVCWFLDRPIDDVVDDLSIVPATPEQYAACTRAYDTLAEFLAREGQTDIRSLKDLR